MLEPLDGLLLLEAQEVSHCFHYESGSYSIGGSGSYRHVLDLEEAHCAKEAQCVEEEAMHVPNAHPSAFGLGVVGMVHRAFHEERNLRDTTGFAGRAASVVAVDNMEIGDSTVRVLHLVEDSCFGDMVEESKRSLAV